MKIAVLEKTNFNEAQRKILTNLGEVTYYENLTQDEANRIAINYDVVIVNWLDPTPFLLDMKPGSLVALLSTGYGWISNIKEANQQGKLVANIPNYSTEAVAEHLLGLLLGTSKNIFQTLNQSNNNKIGFELKDKTIGIIGLGNIGERFAEIMNFFGSNVITYNRNKKNSEFAQDVSLEVLLKSSDVICVSCSVNEDSINMINGSNIQMLKKGVIIIGTTWGVIDENILPQAINKNIISYISFDAAIEGNSTILNKLDLTNNNIFLTPHIAYNTIESEKRQLDICIDNIYSYSKGKPKNIVF